MSPRSVDNVQLVVAEEAIEEALRSDDLQLAGDLALSYQRRVPGPEAQAYLGRVRWRQGDLLQGEALARRAGERGIPGAYISQAQAAASRGRLSEASELVGPALEVEELARRAHGLLGAVALAEGRVAEANNHLSSAVDGERGPARAAGDAADARAFATLVVLQDHTSVAGWGGSWSEIEARIGPNGEVLVSARINGVPADLRLDLSAARSSLSTGLAEKVGLLAQGSRTQSVAARLAIGAAHRDQVFRVAQLGPDEGVLGFDALAAARWIVRLQPPRLVVGPGDGDPRGTPFERETLETTHWIRVRALRDGLAVQLLAMPRVDGRVVSASLDLAGPTLLDERQLRDGVDPADPTVEIRVGGWRGEQSIGTADLHPRASGGRVAPQLVLGRDFLRHWELRWNPGSAQMTLQRLD